MYSILYFVCFCQLFFYVIQAHPQPHLAIWAMEGPPDWPRPLRACARAGRMISTLRKNHFIALSMMSLIPGRGKSPQGIANTQQGMFSTSGKVAITPHITALRHNITCHAPFVYRFALNCDKIIMFPPDHLNRYFLPLFASPRQLHVNIFFTSLIFTLLLLSCFVLLSDYLHVTISIFLLLNLIYFIWYQHEVDDHYHRSH